MSRLMIYRVVLFNKIKGISIIAAKLHHEDAKAPYDLNGISKSIAYQVTVHSYD